MLIIGERINSSRKQIAQAILSHNSGFIQNEAKAQTDAGATYIDLNAGSFIGEEAKYLKWLIEVVQEVTDHPLCIDSPDPKVIKAVLPMIKTAPMINSITLEPDRLKGILPLVAEYKSKVVALCQTQDSIAETTEDKVKLAG
jgi:5-methyltetrahydrofolate--homocysteine methyltransferase